MHQILCDGGQLRLSHRTCCKWHALRSHPVGHTAARVRPHIHLAHDQLSAVSSKSGIVVHTLKADVLVVREPFTDILGTVDIGLLTDI